VSREGNPGAVFDCVVCLQAVVSQAGPAAAALSLLDAGAITLFVGAETLAELRDVLTRSKLRQKRRSTTEGAGAGCGGVVAPAWAPARRGGRGAGFFSRPAGFFSRAASGRSPWPGREFRRFSSCSAFFSFFSPAPDSFHGPPV
jgi:hypothetical protein